MPARPPGPKTARSKGSAEDEDVQREARHNPGNDPLAISQEALKSAIWYTVAQIVQEEEVDLPRSATEPFVASLTDLVYAQCGTCICFTSFGSRTVLWLTSSRSETLALDLKAFAAHANRNTIRAEDIKLVARKTSALQGEMRDELQRYEQASNTDKSTKAKAAFKPPAPRP
ncbi:hypothetical protein DFH28DRAFT_421519 [Melampsora americana]|nr:hypothetical protein DFH28DRAFT_421519 [Melampsora americana]